MVQSRCLRVAVAAASLLAIRIGQGADETGTALLARFCGGCHGAGGAEGGVDLDHLLAALPPGAAVAEEAARNRWVAVWENLRAETMPPADESRPSAAERQTLLEFVQRRILGVDAGRPDPGHVVLRRLNRVEYANTVRDLTGIARDFQDDLPADDTGYGFDTIGAVLSLPPLLMEKYLAIAAQVGELVAAEAVAAPGPDGGRAYPAHLRRLLPFGPPPADPAMHPDHLRRTIRRLAERGFRQPPHEQTIDRLVAVAEQAGSGPGGSFERGIAAAVTAVVAAPRFLFRIEGDAPRAASTTEGGAVPLDDFALASRLSYFLWSTMPDDELFTLARIGSLREQLAGQVTRMVTDRRSDAFVENFVGQWLQTRDVEALPFDLRRLLGLADLEAAERIFGPEVRRAMRAETELLFARVLREGLPATDLLVGRQTFLNEPLARFYGIPGVLGKQMRLVELPADSPRGGLLTQGSFLVVTSNPTRTSPVKRGLFVLDNLLGTPAPPAPPEVPPLEDAAASLGADASMRELMDRHRRDPLCASCHARMDPLGLSLERFNALGQWRSEEAAGGLDTAGRLITGEPFADVRELAAVIAGPRRRDFHRCLTEKMLTYALGRGLEYFDGPAVDTIVDGLAADGRLLTLVHGVVASAPFQMRRGSDESRPRRDHLPPPASREQELP
jgi:hypothetical protein